MGLDTFDIEFITIGNPGNVADTTGTPNPVGAVPYTYRIAKNEVSIDMIDKANALSTAAGAPLAITRASSSPSSKPAWSISWFEAAKFVNWLNTSTGGMAAYKFDSSGSFQLWSPGDAGYNANNLYRNNLARYFLPSDNEWYKAAFYDPGEGVYYDYATGSNSIPIAVSSGTAAGTAVYNQGTASGPADISFAGGLSPYGTMAQNGNVWEWMESSSSSVSIPRGHRGGDWKNIASVLPSTVRLERGPSEDSLTVGIRVASVVPEPTGIMLVAVGLPMYVVANRKLPRRNCA
jgi:formylglycine-generating enzyme required for sulfatase activity